MQMLINIRNKRSKLDPTKLLKVPEGAYRMANQKGVLHEFLFYNQIKSLNPQGYFSRGSGIKFIKDSLKISDSTLYRNLKKLEKLTWVKRVNGNAIVTNYDHIWITLGLDPHKEKIKIHKVLPGDRFIETLLLEEIKLNLKRQKQKMFVNHVKQELFNDDVQHPEYMQKSKFDMLVRKLKPYVTKHLKQCHRDQLRYFKKHLHYKGPNFDITLTCKGISQLFGYIAESQGYIIQQLLKNCNLITITRRSLLINKNFKGKGYVELPKSLYVKGKHLYKQLPNLISVI
jgi:hypothetical protein